MPKVLVQKVLVVSNNRFVVDPVLRWVRSIRNSAKIVHAKHGDEAWRIVLRRKVDLVIAVVELDGVRLSQRIKKRHPEIAVVLISAKGEPQNHKADAFVKKPVFKKELSATIIRLVPFERPTAKSRKSRKSSGHKAKS